MINRCFELIKKKKRFCIYTLIAGSSTLMDMCVLFLLTEYVGIWYWYSSAISYSLGIIYSYGVNKYFNFKNESHQIAQQLSVFAFVSIIGLVINQITIYILVEYFLIWYMIARILSAFVSLLWNYYGHKNFAFKIYK